MAEFMMVVDLKRKVYKVRRNDPDSVLKYKKMYRFSKENVEWLAQHFLGYSGETRGGALTNVQRMKILLRYVGDPGFQLVVSEDIGVKQSTVSRTVSQVAEKIVAKANLWIKFPTSATAMQEAQAMWQESYTFPHALGAVGCTHVHIKRPHVNGDQYINKRGVTSINVLATCNAKEEFTSVDVSWPGSAKDSQIWENSDVCRVMGRRDTSALLIGDTAYGIAPWLMTPFKNPATAEQTAYNMCINKERAVIGRCFRKLKKRFPILQSKIRVATEKIPSIILCCFILHNIAKYLGDAEFQVPEFTDNEDDGAGEEDDDDDDVNCRKGGQQRRDELARVIHDSQH